jgi:hypothetical protein
MPRGAFGRNTSEVVTRDPSSPQGLFGGHPNSTRMTVSAGQVCNTTTSRDDGDVRVLALDLGASELSAVQEASSATIAAMNRPQANHVRLAFSSMLQPMGLQSPGG